MNGIQRIENSFKKSKLFIGYLTAGDGGIMVEVHPEPDKSVSDAAQTISPESFRKMMILLREIGKVVDIKVL